MTSDLSVVADRRPATGRTARWEMLAIAALTLLAMGGALVATRPRPVLTPDSIVYVVSAAHLAEGRGHTDVDGRAATLFPPGFPALLAPAEMAGVDAAEAATVVNASLLGVIVVLGWRLARRHVIAPTVAMAVAAALTVSAPLLVVSTRVWSEPLFVTLTLAALLALERALAAPGIDRRSLAFAGMATGASVLVRYQGVVMVAIGAAVLATAARRHGWRDALTRVATFSAVAVVPALLWGLRNIATGTGPFGPRAPAVDDLGATTNRFAQVLTEWLVPSDWVGPEPPTARPGVLLVAGAVLVAATLAHVLGTNRDDGVPPPATPPPAGADAWPLTALAAQFVLASGWMVVTGTITPLNPLDTRLLILVYPSLVVLVGWAIEVLVRSTPSGMPHLVAAGVAGTITLTWGATSAQRWVHEVDVTEQECCFGARFMASPLHARALALPDDVPLYSDLPDGLWLLERGTYRYLPALGTFRGADRRDERPALVHDVACAGEAWVAYYGVGRTWLFAPEELTDYVHVTPAPHPGTKGIYRLTPLPGTLRPDDC